MDEHIKNIFLSPTALDRQH